MSAIADFGDGLKRLREDRGLSQVALGRVAGVTQSHLSAYETGKRLPNVETLGRILDALGADLLDLHNALAAVRGEPVVARAEEPPHARPQAVPPAPEKVMVELMREEVRRLAAEAAAALGRERLSSLWEPIGAEPEDGEGKAAHDPDAVVAAGVGPDV